MLYIVDRFEEDYVVLEDEEKNTINIHKSKFNFYVKQGDVVTFDEFGKLILDEEHTDERRKKIDEKIIDLWM